MRTRALQYLYLQKPVTMVAIISIITVLPWIGFNTLNTDDVLVVEEMLDTGNYFVPDNGYDLPVFYWLISFFSLLQGVVTPFTYHLPAILAFVGLICATLIFFGRMEKFQEAFIAVLLLITCTGLQTGALIAPSKLLFTLFMFLTLVCMYNWEEKRELQGLPVIIPGLISCAILTEGLTGLLLPLLIFGIWQFSIKKHSTLRIIKALGYTTIASLFFPILWVLAVDRAGGEIPWHRILTFHILPHFPYPEDENIFSSAFAFLKSLTLGFMPWAIFLVFSLFGIKWTKKGRFVFQYFKEAIREMKVAEPIKYFSLIALCSSVAFYMVIPLDLALFPFIIYPFMAIFVSQYLIYITEYRNWCTKGFALCLILASVGGLSILLLTQTGSFDLMEWAANHVHSLESLGLATRINNNIVAGKTSIYAGEILMVISLAILIYQLFRKINIKILYATLGLIFTSNLLICLLLN